MANGMFVLGVLFMMEGLYLVEGLLMILGGVHESDATAAM